MDTLTLTLPSQLFYLLQERARQIGRSPEAVAQDLLAEQLAPACGKQTRLDETIQAMYARGELVATSPDLAQWAADLRRSLGNQEELQAWRREMEDTVLSPPLSQVILDMRGPKP